MVLALKGYLVGISLDPGISEKDSKMPFFLEFGSKLSKEFEESLI